MYNHKNNISNTEINSSVEVATKFNDVCLIDVGAHKEETQVTSDHINSDFSGALRLLLFSDKVIQPFEKKFIVDALSLGLETHSPEEQLALARALAKAGKICMPLADKLLLTGADHIKKILLENYKYHSEEALCSTAAEGCGDVLSVVAEREGLTNKVVSALLNRDDINVTRIVLANKYADCDRSVIEQLLSMKISDVETALSMLDLPDMEPALALKLFWHVPAEVRLVILKRFLKSHALVEGHFARMRSPNLRALPLFSSTGEHTLNTEAIAQGMQAAIDYFKQGQVENALKLITLCVPLPVSLLNKIINDFHGEAVVVLLKALGLNRELSQAYLMNLSESPMAKNWSSLGYLYEVFDVISWGEARMALSYWLWQVERLGPYQALEGDCFLENISSMDDVSREAILGA